MSKTSKTFEVRAFEPGGSVAKQQSVIAEVPLMLVFSDPHGTFE